MLSIFSKRFTFRIVFLSVLLGLLGSSFHAQQTSTEDFPSELPSGDSLGNRSLNDLTSGAKAFQFKKPVYLFKRKIVRPTRVPPRADVPPKSSKPAPKPKLPPKPKYDLPADPSAKELWETLGVTVWRIPDDGTQVPEGNETARLLVQDGGKKKEYTPVRANADTIFKLGDKVRISIETPRSGYLYLVDREILGGDKLGDPWQLFPTMRSLNGNNTVRSGQLIDIPGQGDPVFTLKSSTPGYRGEMLTIIFSPVPLKDMVAMDEPAPIAADLVEEMEERYLNDAGEYEQQGTNGLAYTKSEKAAGSGTRQLVQGDPYPQTKYRVKVRPKEPMVINVALNVK